MSESHYERLTQLDHSFLIYEGANAPMHVGVTAIFEAAPLRRGDGTLDLERIEQWVLSRLAWIPRYRQRLAWTPLERHPIWVDDACFNLHYHVRHGALPRPGDERLLKRTAGRILSQHLDRGKPLWELWLIEGLEGDRVAVITKTHHCMIDGVSGADLLSTLLTHEPVEKIEPPPVWLPRPAPGDAELARDRLLQGLRAPAEGAAALLSAARDAGGRQRIADRLAALGRVAASSLETLSPTPLNQPIGPYRRIDWLPMDLGAVRAVARTLGGTVNDVVLATVAGGLRRFLGRFRQEDVEGLTLKVMAPVSLRSDVERGRLGNRVAAWLVPLPVGERDPRRRFECVRAVTSELKRSKAALGADTLTQMAEWTGPALLRLGSRLMTLTPPPFHLVVTNVPGPRETLYLLGAPMLAAHPMVPLVGSLSTGIALFSYRDTLSWGFTADWDLVPDLHDLVESVQHAFGRLAAAAERESPAAASVGTAG